MWLKFTGRASQQGSVLFFHKNVCTAFHNEIQTIILWNKKLKVFSEKLHSGFTTKMEPPGYS